MFWISQYKWDISYIKVQYHHAKFDIYHIHHVHENHKLNFFQARKVGSNECKGSHFSFSQKLTIVQSQSKS